MKNFNRKWFHQYYNHYTELPDNFVGLTFTGKNQTQRALDLVGPNNSKYYYESTSFHSCTLWLHQSEVNTVGEYIRTGKPFYDVLVGDSFYVLKNCFSKREALQVFNRCCRTHERVYLWQNNVEKPIKRKEA